MRALLWIAGCLLAAAAAQATPLTYDLQGVTFDDGGTASGYFVYDASSNSVTDWNITTDPGNGPWHLSQKTYTTSNSSAGFAVSPGPFGTAWWFVITSTSFFHPINPVLPATIRFGTDVVPTNAGGLIPLAANGQDGECYECSRFRGFAAGSLVAPVVPEPGALTLLGAALVAAILRRRLQI